MSSTVHEIRSRLRHRLIPALPVPFTSDRRIDSDAHVRMAEYLQSSEIGGVAVWAHTGRGLMLSEAERTVVLTHWREAMPERLVIAGAGASTADGACRSDDDYISRATIMAEHARALGADAVLCYAPSRFRDRSATEKHRLIVRYHEAIASAGLPLILFYLYEAAGGVSYTPDLLRDLFMLPNVVGIKMATLNSVMTYQDVAAFMRAEYPKQLLITGEDRFLGYSLMAGADAALIGMGTALVTLQTELMSAYYAGRMSEFQQLSSIVDGFARATFKAPMEGYIARMLHALAELAVISREATFDPWGPSLTLEDLGALEHALRDVTSTLRR